MFGTFFCITLYMSVSVYILSFFFSIDALYLNKYQATMKLYDKGIENVKWLFVADPKGKITCQEILELIPSLKNTSNAKKVMIKFQEKHPDLGIKEDIEATHLITWNGIKIASMDVLLNRYKEAISLTCVSKYRKRAIINHGF